MSTDLIKLGHLFAEIASGRDLSRFDEIVAPIGRRNIRYAERIPFRAVPAGADPNVI